jgi:diguanylate cyclase (GGDEF)-like protein
MAKKNDDLKVLVVEDSRVTMKSLCNYLKRMGIENPLTATTGQAAMEIFRKNRPDIVLLDAILPDIDGFDIAKHFRATERGDDWTAIIFLTSMDKDEDLARGIAAGGDDYLVKPISATVLESKMRAMKRLVTMQRTLVDVTQQLNTANKKLQRLSMTDGLTGLANRRFFDEMSAREWRRCERVQKPMAVVMLDVDFFKKYNDTYGHQAGDECLKGVARSVARAAPRATDLAARYGGEEFVLVLGETTTEGAKQVAANICEYVAQLNMPHSASDIGHVSISCGVASALPLEGMSFDILLKIADEALYKAKQQGRNRVVCAE